MKKSVICLVAGLAIASCSSKANAVDRYDELLQCEMRVLVVAKFHPSLKASERAFMNEKLASLSKSVIESAASLDKSAGQVAEDQRTILMKLQERVSGPSADSEANRIVDEARSCE